MAAAPNTRIRITDKATRGEVIQIRAIIQHPMENGYNFDSQGTAIPVHIIDTFTCVYNGVEIFRAKLEPGMAANPYLSFYTTATESGKFEFEWIGDRGFSETASATITVE